MLPIPPTTHLAEIPRPWPLTRTHRTSPKSTGAIRRGRTDFRQEALPVIGDITVIAGLEELLPIAAFADVARGVNHRKNGAFARDDFIGVEDGAGG